MSKQAIVTSLRSTVEARRGEAHPDQSGELRAQSAPYSRYSTTVRQYYSTTVLLRVAVHSTHGAFKLAPAKYHCT